MKFDSKDMVLHSGIKIFGKKNLQSAKMLKSVYPLQEGTGGFMYYAGNASVLFRQNAAITMAREISRAHVELDQWQEVLKMK